MGCNSGLSKKQIAQILATQCIGGRQCLPSLEKFYRLDPIPPPKFLSLFFCNITTIQEIKDLEVGKYQKMPLLGDGY